MIKDWVDSPVLSGLITLMEVAGWVLAIGVWFFYKVRQEADKQEAKLIKALQNRVTLLEQSDQEAKKLLEKINARNEILEDLILKTTPEDKKFRERVTKALTQIDAMYQQQIGGK